MPVLPARILRAGATALFTLLSVGVAAWAFAYLYLDIRPGDSFQVRYALSGLDVPLHFFGAGLALALAPLQLAGAVRRRVPALHRIGGWLYAGGVLAAGLAGLSLATDAHGGMASGSGFALLAVAWILVTGNGIRHAVAGNVGAHRRWMCRSVAMTFAAVTLRLGLALGVGVLDLAFTPVYVAMAWGSWTLNLALCELWLRRGSRLSRPRPRPAAGTRSAWSRPGA